MKISLGSNSEKSSFSQLMLMTLGVYGVLLLMGLVTLVVYELLSFSFEQVVVYLILFIPFEFLGLLWEAFLLVVVGKVEGVTFFFPFFIGIIIFSLIFLSIFGLDIKNGLNKRAFESFLRKEFLFFYFLLISSILIKVVLFLMQIIAYYPLNFFK